MPQQIRAPGIFAKRVLTNQAANPLRGQTFDFARTRGVPQAGAKLRNLHAAEIERAFTDATWRRAGRAQLVEFTPIDAQRATRPAMVIAALAKSIRITKELIAGIQREVKHTRYIYRCPDYFWPSGSSLLSFCKGQN
jgi:hypothetical protein